MFKSKLLVYTVYLTAVSYFYLLWMYVGAELSAIRQMPTILPLVMREIELLLIEITTYTLVIVTITGVLWWLHLYFQKASCVEANKHFE